MHRDEDYQDGNEEIVSIDVEPHGGAPGYRIEIIADARGLDPDAGNADVVVAFEDGARWNAAFMTIKNINTLISGQGPNCTEKNYLWAANMVVVQSIAPRDVAQTVAAMILRGEFELAFGGPSRL